MTGGFMATQKYYYDSLNRIDDSTETISSTQTWRQDFTYDRYGNRNFNQTNTTMPSSFASPAITNPAISTTNKRITSSGYNYDASGNTTFDASLRKFTYDAENKQTKVESTNSSQTVTGTVGEYSYDGDGKRVKKYVPSTGETTIFVYDASGKSIAEYSTIVANSADAKVAYLTSDHLGSPRINTDANGAVIARHDYHPFGEEIYTAQRTTGLNYAADTVRKQFTSYERDNETNLDFAKARYHNYNLGRFQSPDPIIISRKRIRNPQLWNSYSYAGNNPLKYVDPDGLERIKLGDKEETIKKDLDEAKKKKKEIEKDKSLSKEKRKAQVKAQNATINTLGTKLEGTRLVNNMLKELNNKKENPNGLQLSDFELTTDPKNDFAGVSADNMTRIMKAEAFTNVPNAETTIFIRTDRSGGFYQQAQRDSDYIFKGAAIVAHEDYHVRNPRDTNHSNAYRRERDVLRRFRFDYRNQSSYDLHLQEVDYLVNNP